MIRPRQALVRLAVTIAAATLASCSDQSILAPALNRGSNLAPNDSKNDVVFGDVKDKKDPKDPKDTKDPKDPKDPKHPEAPLPFAVPYSGVLRKGQFVVCTSKNWPPASSTATYSIHVNSADPTDRYVTTATVPAGECAVVFDSNNRKDGIVPWIDVVSDPSFNSWGVMLIDGTGVNDDAIWSEGPQGWTLRGFAGAVAKFYYSVDDPYPCPLPEPCAPGGHGGTGTFTGD